MRTCIPLLLFPLCSLAPAQETARLSLRILDPQGAVIPAAAVTLTPHGGGQPCSTQSDEQGAARFAALVPGTYRVHVVAPGFDDYRAESLALHTR